MAKYRSGKELASGLTEQIDKAVQTAASAGINDAIDVLKIRIQSGTSITGGSVKGYSKEYKDYRAKKGRKTNPVDWNFSGKMLAGIRAVTPKKIRRGIETGVTISRSEFEKLKNNIKLRPNFWGFGKKELDQLVKTIKANLKF